ncbi:hypothetical protein HPB47_024983 [Ixodes persulcatus]|uniref:Uncharacterized protein n=1 Tax=Ixodes persulcatus TaxID=34615 RepID=A0AC60Q3G1_IXOPE|nr:hypothetical protein HPB47_024983 [Ixodes persulcatus]
MRGMKKRSRRQTVGYASHARWRDQCRPSRGANPSEVRPPFRGLTLADRDDEPPAVYTAEEEAALCPVCHVLVVCQEAHTRGKLHTESDQRKKDAAAAAAATEGDIEAALKLLRRERPELLTPAPRWAPHTIHTSVPVSSVAPLPSPPTLRAPPVFPSPPCFPVPGRRRLHPDVGVLPAPYSPRPDPRWRRQTVGYASHARWRDQYRPSRGANPSEVRPPFRGLTLADRDDEPPAVYTAEEEAALCPVCHVLVVCQEAHTRGKLHTESDQRKKDAAAAAGATEGDIEAALKLLRRERPELLTPAPRWAPTVGYASHARWRDQYRPSRGANPSEVRPPFRGLTLADRDDEPPAVYTAEEEAALCPVCHVLVVCQEAHIEGKLHTESDQLEERRSGCGRCHRGEHRGGPQAATEGAARASDSGPTLGASRRRLHPDVGVLPAPYSPRPDPRWSGSFEGGSEDVCRRHQPATTSSYRPPRVLTARP